MKVPFSIEHEWLKGDAAKDVDHEMRAAVAIWVNETCLTEVEERTNETTRTRRSVRVSALRLAHWLASNWWRLRWEPTGPQTNTDWEMSHNLAAIGGGYLWPSLTLSSDGETVLAVAKSSAANSDEPIRYLQDYAGVIPAADFESAVDRFVKHTIDSMSTEGRDHTNLVDLWSEVIRERKDPVLAEVRRLEARLGYDPAEAPEELINRLFHLRSKYGADAIQELAVVSKDQSVQDLESLGAAIRTHGESAQLPNCDAIRDNIRTHINPMDPPWQRGEQAAGIARKIWKLPSGPLPTGLLTELFAVQLNQQAQSDLQMSGALRDPIRDGMQISLHQRHPIGRRFTLARLVADQIATPNEERLLPATNARTSRQKFQRAFARELLCPIDDLIDFLGQATPDEDDIVDAAAHFQVSDRAVAHTLVNKGIIQREYMGEWTV